MSPLNHLEDASRSCALPRSRRLRGVQGLAFLVALVLTTGHAAADQPSVDEVGTPLRNRPSVCGDRIHATAQGYQVPGRKPDSLLPWKFFLGNASHRLLGYIYSSRHPAHRVFYNKYSIKFILKETGIGNWALLPEDELDIRPDITNATLRRAFEVKPSGERGLAEGLQEIETYLRALNRTVPPTEWFLGGTGFEGEILIRFALGQHIWRLEWCTNAPGVTQYQWTRSQEHLDSLAAAHDAGKWVEISEQELKEYGGWVAQVVEEMVDRREKLATISGVIGVVIDTVGGIAVVTLSSVMGGDRRALPTTNQGLGLPPGGKVIPLPPRPPATAPPVQLPKASGM